MKEIKQGWYKMNKVGMLCKEQSRDDTKGIKQGWYGRNNRLRFNEYCYEWGLQWVA